MSFSLSFCCHHSEGSKVTLCENGMVWSCLRRTCSFQKLKTLLNVASPLHPVFAPSSENACKQVSVFGSNDSKCCLAVSMKKTYPMCYGSRTHVPPRPFHPRYELRLKSRRPALKQHPFIKVEGCDVDAFQYIVASEETIGEGAPFASDDTDALGPSDAPGTIAFLSMLIVGDTCDVVI